MARVTIADCLKNVPNRFELVIMASKRARELGGNAVASVPQGNDKKTVIALREIAHWDHSAGAIRERAIVDLQRELAEVDEPEETEMHFPKHLINKGKSPNAYKTGLMREPKRKL